MNKLLLDQQLPQNYDRQAVSRIIRAICNQVNSVSENRINAKYNAQNTVPSGGSVSYAVGDFVPNSSPVVIGSPGQRYFIEGWECVTSGTPGTFQNRVIPIEFWSTAAGVGTVTSVDASVIGGGISVVGGPITASGVLTFSIPSRWSMPFMTMGA